MSNNARTVKLGWHVRLERRLLREQLRTDIFSRPDKRIRAIVCGSMSTKDTTTKGWAIALCTAPSTGVSRIFAVPKSVILTRIDDERRILGEDVGKKPRVG
jgi:hypothetical protein